jgi:hypothetical protein
MGGRMWMRDCPHQQAQEVEGPKPRPEDNDTRLTWNELG